MEHFHTIHRTITKSKKLLFVKLFLSLGIASISTIWSLYMNSLGLSESAIGFISAAFVVITFATVLFITPILEYFKQTKIIITSIIFAAGAYILIGLFNSLTLFLIMGTIITIMVTIRRVCFSIIFRDNVKNKDLNKEEGFLYAISNIGWLLGPLIAGFFMIAYGIASVFFVAGGFFIITLILFLLIKLKNIPKHRTEIHKNIFKNIKTFLKEKTIRLPYVMTIGIGIWWSLIYIYTPIFIIKNNLNPSTVGVFLACIVIPLILFETTVSKLSLKTGFRKFFIAGFLGVSIIVLIIFFVQNIIIQLVLLGIGNIFVSFVEPLQDTFFFKSTKQKDEEKYYPLFKTSNEMGSFIGKAAIAGVLLFLPNNYAYLMVFVLMITITFFAMKIPKNKH